MTERSENRAPEGGDPSSDAGTEGETVFCRRLGREGTRLAKPPFRNELGERIREAISAEGWEDWLRYQTAIINHYGLDPRDPEARKFLYRQIEEILLGEGGEDEIDTSKKGSIEW